MRPSYNFRAFQVPLELVKSREIGAGRLATEAGRLFDAASDHPEAPQGEDLLLPVIPQHVGHSGGRPQGSLPRQRHGAALPGFQVSTTDRFWVSTEVRKHAMS